MTARQYKRIEDLLAKAETVSLEHPLLTSEGHKIKAAIQELLVRVAAERIRAENREDVTAPPLREPKGS